VSSSAAADESRLFVGAADGHLYAMLWHNPQYRRPVQLWRAMAGGTVRAAPVYVDRDHIYCASKGGQITCCTAAKKIEQWSFRAGRAIAGEIEVSPDGVFAASIDRSLYRIGPLNQKLHWRRRMPEILERGPVKLGNMVYQHCPGRGVYAIDAQYGDIRWNRAEADQVLARDAGQVYILSDAGDLLAVDNETGDARGRLVLPNKLMSAVNRVDDAVYLLSPTGSLLCARPLNTPPLSPQQMQAAHATLNRPPPRPASP
jgi:outer membrane protein assembly factor BamB